MADNISQHFRADEQPFIETVTGWLQQSQDEYRPILTAFLNPRQVYITETLVNQNDAVKMQSAGGYPQAETARVLIYPEYYQPQISDFELTLFEIVYPVKFAQLKHGQILGTLANLGIERDVFGDIISDGERWQFFCEQGMADYFTTQVDRIGKVKVHLTEQPLNKAVAAQNDWEAVPDTVSSLRADSIISAAFNLSRHHSKELIEAQRVKINWATLTKADYELATFDMLSVKGYGRVRLGEIAGLTKKAKQRVTLEIIHSK